MRRFVLPLHCVPVAVNASDAVNSTVTQTHHGTHEDLQLLPKKGHRSNSAQLIFKMNDGLASRESLVYAVGQ